MSQSPGGFCVHESSVLTHTRRSRSGFSVWQCVKVSRKILCLRKIRSNTHAGQGQASAFGSVWKSPGRFCVYKRSVLTHMQIKVRLQRLAVCGRVQEDFVFTKDQF